MMISLGCRGTIPQPQQIQLTEDPVVRTASVEAPPQRLASHASQSSSKSDTSQSNTAIKPQTSDALQSAKTRLVGSTASTYEAKVTSTNQHVPKRSDAVESLLAANRKATRAKQSESPQKSDTNSKVLARPKAASNLTPNAGAVAKAKSPPKTSSQTRMVVAKSDSQSTDPKVKNGDSMSFSDLPADVRQRALKRLVANLSKQAVSTAQPATVDANLQDALGHLPKLAPLRKSTPEITPQRIAAKTTTPSPKQQAAPKTRVLRDVQVSDLFATKKHSSEIDDVEMTPAPEVHVADFTKPKVKATVAASTKSQVADSAPPGLPAKRPAVTQQVATLRADTPQKKSTGFTMPALEHVEPPVLAAIELPKAKMASKPTVPRSQVKQESNTQWTLPPQFESPQVRSTVSGAVAQNDAPTVQQPISKTPDLSSHKTDSQELALSSLSRELEPLPHELHRDQFRMSRVGLPEPDVFFADLPSNGEHIQQASPNTDTYAFQQSEANAKVLSIPAQADHHKTAQVSSVIAGDVEMKRPLTKQAKTPSYDLPSIQSTAKEVAIDLPSRELTESEPVTAPRSMSDQELYDALLARLTDPSQAETPAERSRRLIMARHLMVLSGNREAAVQEMKGLSEEEQEFLRHQLEGLYAMVDPKGHPVAGRRFSSALPELRQATMHLSAAADSLEVRGLDFCTEIEAYGQVKPFPTRQFAAGQQVILYCEIENFAASKTEAGYETHLKGSYDVFDKSGRKLISQLLPADKQMSRNLLRDYFVAYQMSLPAKLSPGKYRLQLTMEDVTGEKYGQSNIEFEITSPR
ncbi:MAG: hypothetical protein WBD20_28365 [Pirellulaceae bacterium]